MSTLVCLDVDGVLNHHKWFKTFAFHEERNRANNARAGGDRPSNPQGSGLFDLAHFCPQNVQTLEHLCHTINAPILVTATMRKRYDLGYFQWIFHQRGVRLGMVGLTPDYRGFPDPVLREKHHNKRGLEIEAWCLLHLSSETLQDLQLVILDDDGDFGRLGPWRIRTSLHTEGLQPKHIEEVLEIVECMPPAGRTILNSPNPLWTSEWASFLYGGHQAAFL